MMKQTMESINLYTLKMIKEKEVLYVTDNLITSPQGVFDLVEKVYELSSEAVEKFGIITLNTKNKVVGMHIISVGTLNAGLVHPREVYKTALCNNAASIIAFHNHPSGDPTCSPEDIEVTKRLVEAGQILGIQLLDHIIIGEGNFYSLKERGHM
jgi:DNA repair protein RadC